MSVEKLLGEGGSRMVCAGEITSRGLVAAVRCERCGRVWTDGEEPILRRCPCGAFLSNKPMAKKRGYSRDYPTTREKRVYFMLDKIPPAFWLRVKAKAKREGVSLRSLILSLLENWLER